jgi:hypothetical protein
MRIARSLGAERMMRRPTVIASIKCSVVSMSDLFPLDWRRATTNNPTLANALNTQPVAATRTLVRPELRMGA